MYLSESRLIRCATELLAERSTCGVLFGAVVLGKGGASGDDTEKRLKAWRARAALVAASSAEMVTDSV